MPYNRNLIILTKASLLSLSLMKFLHIEFCLMSLLHMNVPNTSDFSYLIFDKLYKKNLSRIDSKCCSSRSVVRSPPNGKLETYLVKYWNLMWSLYCNFYNIWIKPAVEHFCKLSWAPLLCHQNVCIEILKEHTETQDTQVWTNV